MDFQHARLNQLEQACEIVDHQHRLLVVGHRHLAHAVAQPRPGVLLEEALFVDAFGMAQEAERPADQVRQDPVGDLAVELGQPLLGDALVGPQQAAGIGEPHRQLACSSPSPGFGLRPGRRLRAAGRWRSLPSTSSRNTAWRISPPPVRPRYSISADSTGSTQRTPLGGAVSSFSGGVVVRKGSSRCHSSRALGRGEARAAMADRHQPVAGILAQHQRAHRLGIDGRGHEARDHEAVALARLHLEPRLHPARAIGRRRLLGDDAFEAKPAGVPEHRIAVARDVVAVAQAAGVAGVGQQLGQRRLARAERRLAQVEAVEIEQVEGIEQHVAAAALQRVDQHGEARHAGRRLHHHLAVDDRDLGRHLGQRGHDDGEALGPVEPLPAEQFYPAVLEMGLQAIAVVLDLVQPAACPRARSRSPSAGWAR